jgi:hypothetical protein
VFDCVISNGVINLSPDKPAVFAAAARALRPVRTWLDGSSVPCLGMGIPGAGLSGALLLSRREPRPGPT